MAENAIDQPKIIIDLDPLLEAFCRLQFKTSVEQDEIKLTRKHDIGKLINSNRSSTNFRVKLSEKKNPVVFILPINPVNKHAVMFSFHYVTPDQEQKIKDGIDYEFKKWCYEIFKEGYRRKQSQKKIIDAILVGLNVRKNVANFDAIKKFDYRNQRNESKKLFYELLTLI